MLVLWLLCIVLLQLAFVGELVPEMRVTLPVISIVLGMGRDPILCYHLVSEQCPYEILDSFVPGYGCEAARFNRPGSYRS